MGFFGRLLGREKPGQPENPEQEEVSKTEEEVSETGQTEKTEGQPLTKEERQKELYDTAERRLKTLGNLFNGIVEKTKRILGGVIEKAKDAGYTLLVGDKILAEGARQTGEAVVDIGKGTAEAVKTGAEFVAGATVAGAEAVGRGVKAGAEFAGEKGREAMDASVKFFKEDWDKTKEHADAAKEFIGTDWNKTKEHGQAMVDTVKGVGVKTGEFIQNTKERTKEIIAEKIIGRLKEYGDHLLFVAGEINDNAYKAVESVTNKAEQIVGGIIEKARGGILAGIDRLKGKLELYRKMAEMAKEAKTKERLANFETLAMEAKRQNEENLRNLEKIVVVSS